MKLLENLIHYRKEHLEEIDINSRKYKILKDYNPTFLVAFSFGAGTYESFVNEQLSQAVISAQEYFGNIPAFVQAEIGEILKKKNRSNFYSIGEERLYKSGDKTKLLSKINSEEVMDLSLKEKQKLEIKNGGIYIAHPLHIERILKIANKKGLKAAPFTPSQVLWNSKDIQKWTNSKYFRIPRELLTRIKYKFSKKI